MLGKYNLKLVVILLVVLISYCALKPEVYEKKKLLSVSKYAIYYGKNKIDKLSRYDLVILDPDNYSKDEILKLKNSTIIIAYLSIYEINPSRKYFSKVKECIIGFNEMWRTYYIDVSCGKWRETIMEEIILEIINKGFDGIFLDTIDDVEIYGKKNEVISLIKNIRERYPKLIIIQNRGFSIVDETAPYIDGILFESFTSRYNWSTSKYEIWGENDLRWTENIAKQLIYLKNKRNLLILTLDYVDMKNESMKNFCIARAKKFGFIPFLSNLNLTALDS